MNWIHTTWIIRRLLLLSRSIRMLTLPKDSSLEILESNHYNCNIIQRLSVQCILEDTFNCQATLLMNILSNLFVFVIDVTTVPHTRRDILIRHFIKDSITCQDNEIMIFVYFETGDIRFTNHNIWIASSEFIFSLRISKSPGYWKSTWKNSYWSYNKICIVFVLMLLLLCTSCSSCLVNLPSCCNYSFIFLVFWWLVVFT